MSKSVIRLLMRGLLCLVISSVLLLGGCQQPLEHTFPDETITRVEVQPDRDYRDPVYSVARLTSLSEAVVYAEVLGREDVRVCDVLKGQLHVGDEVCVRDTGYVGERLGEEAECTIYGEPLMRKGNRVVLFLHTSTTKRADGVEEEPVFSLTAQELGKFFVDQEQVCYPAMMLSDSYRNGKRIYMTLERMEARPLEELFAEVRDCIAASEETA